MNFTRGAECPFTDEGPCIISLRYAGFPLQGSQSQRGNGLYGNVSKAKVVELGDVDRNPQCCATVELRPLQCNGSTTVAQLLYCNRYNATIVQPLHCNGLEMALRCNRCTTVAMQPFRIEVINCKEQCQCITHIFLVWSRCEFEYSALCYLQTRCLFTSM